MGCTEQVLLTSLLLRLTITTNICITYLCYARTSRKMTLVSKVSEYPYNSKQDTGIKDTDTPPLPGCGRETENETPVSNTSAAGVGAGEKRAAPDMQSKRVNPASVLSPEVPVNNRPPGTHLGWSFSAI